MDPSEVTDPLLIEIIVIIDSQSWSSSIARVGNSHPRGTDYDRNSYV